MNGTAVFLVTDGNDINPDTAVFLKTDNEDPLVTHPALVLKRDLERNKILQGDQLCELTNREVYSSFDLEFCRESVGLMCQTCVILLLLDRAEPIFANNSGGRQL